MKDKLKQLFSRKICGVCGERMIKPSVHFWKYHPEYAIGFGKDESVYGIIKKGTK